MMAKESEDREKNLIDAGAVREKKEDRHGETLKSRFGIAGSTESRRLSCGSTMKRRFMVNARHDLRRHGSSIKSKRKIFDDFREPQLTILRTGGRMIA